MKWNALIGKEVSVWEMMTDWNQKKNDQELIMGNTSAGPLHQFWKQKAL